MTDKELDYQLTQQYFVGDAERYAEFLKAFNRNKDVTRLRDKKRSCLEKGDYMGFSFMEKKIQQIKKETAKNYYEETQKNLDTIDNDQSLRSILELQSIVVCMLSDMMEQAEMKIQESLAKQGITNMTFGDHITVIKACRAQLKWLYDVSNLLDDNSWGVACDKLLVMVENKAKRLIDDCIKRDAKRKESTPVSAKRS
jgi:hypothetical protein